MSAFATAIASIAPIGAPPPPLALTLGAVPVTPPASQAASTGFGAMMMNGLRGIDARVADANQLVRAFAVDDSIPVHQVTLALEQARLSVELAMQVRQRLVESYRELMNMQL
ncbi:MAG: flagellar hook-basal body complex protein FliE [Sphingomonas sp.]|nr:flagellar hook-basal body complex protein FliE [Sphingomonas sp.]